MEKRKTKRLEEERRTLLKRRLTALKKVLETYVSTLPVNALHPSTGELFRNPAIRDMVYNENEYKSLDCVLELLPDISAQWLKDIREQLINMVKAARPGYVFDPDTVLDLATTAFRCKSCDRNLRYPAVLMHSCAFKRNYGNLSDLNSHERLMSDVIQETYWNTFGRIFYQESHAKAITEVLEMAGFDPAVTTSAEMDSANPVFECIGCNTESEGRLTMQWIAAVCSFGISFILVSENVVFSSHAGPSSPEAPLRGYHVEHGTHERRGGCNCATKNY